MIKVEGLTRYYGRFPAIRDVSFTIDDRVIVGFLGLNGAGKSTVLKCLGGLLMPSAGTVRINGIDALAHPEKLRSRIGFLPEDPPLYRDMQVRDFLRWCGRMKGMTSEDVDRRLPEVLQICDLEHMADRVIETLSHGYRKRVGIAQAIIHDPDLVILDEPISGLDPVQIVGMRKVLRQLKGTCTILVSSHILSEISATCDRLLVLHEGRIVADGSEEELSERLEGRSRIDVAVRGDFATARQAILSVDGVTDVVEGHERNGVVELDVGLARDAREEVVAALVEAGLGIRRVDEAESELENVFIGLTQTRNEIAEAS